MKNLLLKSFLLLAVISFWACPDNEPKQEKVCNTTVVTGTESVQICLFPYKASINSCCLDYSIINHTGKEMVVGNNFLLEFSENGVWKNVELDFVFSDEGNLIFPEKSFEAKICMPASQFKYGKGKYRIAKTENIEGVMCDMFVEFEVY